jgi:2-amino-4-hydroxy-6-hydroxymethyldihydropteridine diphosphokinase
VDDELVIVGVGGNVGSDEEILARFAGVVSALEVWSTVRGSRVYRTDAIGPAQAPYLNAALAVEAPEDLTASELIREVLGIERALGRTRDGTRDAPRLIDVDVLLWGARTFAFKGPPALEVPHPRLHERAFALAPVIDLVGAEVAHPRLGTPLGELRAAVAEQRVELTGYAIAGAPPAPHLLDR